MKQTTKRWILFILGSQLLAIGIVLNTKTGLGVAAFSSVFCEISTIFGISLGTASFLLYIVFILIQLALMKKASLSAPSILLQIPFSAVFGFFTDMYDTLIPLSNFSTVEAYVMLIPALVATSLGIYLMVQCNLVVTPVEGIVNAIARASQTKFGTVKNRFDITMVALSVVMCLLLQEPITSIGVGTVISAIAIGRLVAIYEKKITLLKKSNARTDPSHAGQAQR